MLWHRTRVRARARTGARAGNYQCFGGRCLVKDS